MGYLDDLARQMDSEIEKYNNQKRINEISNETMGICSELKNLTQKDLESGTKTNLSNDKKRAKLNDRYNKNMEELNQIILK